ncbi:hypothetical protein GCM10023217_33700 [Gordonia alkaliphila]|uniref:Transposase n=1 Tax=Gordonia alkaliphila TaxID=1053547 RepID=A0ABP8ZJI6_9ACTN
MRDINENLDNLRTGKFRKKKRNIDLWRQVLDAERSGGHTLAKALVPDASDPDATTAQQHARAARTDQTSP